MRGIDQFLFRHTRVGLDTSIFIYELENVSPYVEVTSQFFRRLMVGGIEAVTSILTLLELTVHPLQIGHSDLADDYEAAVSTYPNLEVIAVDHRIVRRAAELRAAYRLTPIDAVQVASAIVAGATSFLSNDRRLTRVAEIDVLLLDDMLP